MTERIEELQDEVERKRCVTSYEVSSSYQVQTSVRYVPVATMIL